MDKNIYWLKEIQYPGRGIVVGATRDAKYGVQVYWLMGRSGVSKNRRLIEEPKGIVKTILADPNKHDGDSSLLFYTALQKTKEYEIVSNGDQTETIINGIDAGKSFIESFGTRDVEPDAPHFTSRIAGILTLGQKKPKYELAIVKSYGRKNNLSSLQHFSYKQFVEGWGHCITTYNGNINPLPSFKGEPFLVRIPNEPEEVLNFYWNKLNEEFRIAIAVKFVDLITNEVKINIFNKF